MLTSIAAIATGITTLIGAIAVAVAAIKKNKANKVAATIADINAQIKVAKTDAERQELQNALNKLINS